MLNKKTPLLSALIFLSLALPLQSKWTDYAPFKWFTSNSTNSNKENLDKKLMQSIREKASIADIKTLLIKGANVNYQDETGASALMVAILEKDIELVTLLLENKADLEAKGKIIGLTPLILAVHNNDLDMTNLLIEKGAEPNTTTEIGFNALMYAVLNGNIDIAELLITHNAAVNAQENLVGLTPLLIAITNKDVQMAQFLLEHNADPSIQDLAGQTALTYAQEQKCDDIIALIIPHEEAKQVEA